MAEVEHRLIDRVHSFGKKAEKKIVAHSDDLKGSSEVSCSRDDGLSERTSAIPSEDYKTLRDTNAAESDASRSLAVLAFTFRQLICSYIASKPLNHVRYVTLRLLEVYVHDEKVFKSREAADRWEHMCLNFGWEEKWDTDNKIPNVVKYIDDKAADAILYSIDLDDVRECLEETRKQLSKGDSLLFLLDKLNQIMGALKQQEELPDDFVVVGLAST